jgi:2-polyprenyl-3-methyl-5-hydroxy-6-metoxy-1,4-benzoquinol methylase
MADFDTYSRTAVHFYSLHVPPILAAAVAGLPDGYKLVDLGCGDGNIVNALKHKGLLDRAGSVTGVDLSELRAKRFTDFTGYPAIVSAGDRVEQIPDHSVDMVMSTMVIEHVPDDAVFLREMRRMLKPGGCIYVTTVLKLRGAWYFRRADDGRWVLDSTHLREYPSRENFEGVVTNEQFALSDVEVLRLKPPVIHPILRLINRVVPLRNVQTVFLEGGMLGWMEKITVPIPRYREIQVVASPNPDGAA